LKTSQLSLFGMGINVHFPLHGPLLHPQHARPATGLDAEPDRCKRGEDAWNDLGS